MKAFVITIDGNEVSNTMADRCIKSIADTKSDLDVEKFAATTPETISEGMKEVWDEKVYWTWPKTKEQESVDVRTRLFKKYYPAKDQMRVIACAVSHARLWKKCVELNEAIMVLEHDAHFTRNFDPETFLRLNTWMAMGINDPRGATRKSGVYHKMVEEHGGVQQKIPEIDDFSLHDLPRGLAGNSAYLIRPRLASSMLERALEIGLWPNDALMCKQLFPSIRVTYPYYTKLQQSAVSTTTGI